MYHSITIGDRNTWSDWHLIPASRPLVNPPPVKTSIIEIPGADGTLDLTETMAGRATFGDRTGSWTFYVENGHGNWADIYSTIMTYLHGKQMTCVFEDDPLFYYEGRFSVNQWSSEASNSKIVINYEVGPYKLYSLDSGDRWIWDTFNFETGVLKSFRNMPVTYGDPLTVPIVGDAMDVIPTINVTFVTGTTSNTGLKLTYEGHTYDLKKGNNILEDVVIRQGENDLVFTVVKKNVNAPAKPKCRVSLTLIGGRL